MILVRTKNCHRLVSIYKDITSYLNSKDYDFYRTCCYIEKKSYHDLTYEELLFEKRQFKSKRSV